MVFPWQGFEQERLLQLLDREEMEGIQGDVCLTMTNDQIGY